MKLEETDVDTCSVVYVVVAGGAVESQEYLAFVLGFRSEIKRDGSLGKMV